jgi:hypothetical protein
MTYPAEPKAATMPHSINHPWQRNLSKSASGKPGVVHTGRFFCGHQHVPQDVDVGIGRDNPPRRAALPLPAPEQTTEPTRPRWVLVLGLRGI